MTRLLKNVRHPQFKSKTTNNWEFTFQIFCRYKCSYEKVLLSFDLAFASLPMAARETTDRGARFH